ncbi:MAG: DUF937 domain-containing protein [Pseudomonadota bacterium]
MSVNLVDLVLKQVGGNVPGILGSLLGESADRTQGAIAGAVPAVLGGLMGAATKGGGLADQLASAIGQQDGGMLDDLAGAFGGGNHQKIADEGGSILTSLLGDGVIGTLVGAIGKFSGLGSGSSKSLLGMLVPVVMSVLSREQKSQGLDAGGLMNMLMGQKDNIQAAMPSGMASALGGAGFLDDFMGGAQSAAASIGDAVDSATGAVGEAAGQAAAAVSGAADQAASAVEGAVESASDAARQAAGSASAAVSQGAEAAGRAAENVASGASQAASGASAAAAGAAQSGGSWLRWLLPLLILAALLWFAFKFLAGGDMEQAASNAGDAASSAVEATTEAASDAATAVTDAASDAADAATDAASDAADAASDAAGSAVEAMSAMVGDVDVGGQLTSAFDGLTETLSGITDTASAEAALPALEDLSSSLDSLTGLADQLPEGAIGGISEMVSSGISSLDSVVANLESIPGVGDLIKPIIDQIKEKLAAFTPA